MKGLIPRAITAVVFVTIMITGTLFHKTGFAVLYTIIAIICGFEWFNLFKETKEDKVFSIGALLIFLAINILLHLPDIQPLIGLIAVIPFVFFTRELFAKGELSFLRLGLLFLALGYILLPIISAQSLNINQGSNGRVFVLMVLLLTWANDAFAYVIGSQFGKNPLFKAVSPNKTIEGSLGGLIMTIIVSVLISILLDYHSLAFWIGLGLVVSIAGGIGDLFESKMKRKLQIKDTGNTLPGHGGFLDRFDAFLFAMPIAFLYSAILT